MKNMDLLNICYKFFNRFIVVDQLIKELSNIDTSKLDNDEIEEINKLIDGIKECADKNPNTEDEYVTMKKEKIKEMISKLENAEVDGEIATVFSKKIEALKKDYDREIDSYDRWFAVTDYINRNDYFSNKVDSLSDYEFFEFITQYIRAPFPPNLNQEKFDKLVKVGIEKDQREGLWRLAFNYEGRNIDYEAIVDYFIDKKDGYYLSELISAVGYDLDIDSIIEKITDKELIKYLLDNKAVIKNHVSDQQFKELENKLN